MPSNLNLDYYYGNEAEQYSFYRIPKTLLTDPRYKSVSIEAKVLYGLLLDRMGLSVKNGWMDGDKRVYIYFTQEDAMNLMQEDYSQKISGAVERVQQLQTRQSELERQVARYTSMADKLAAVDKNTALSALLVNQLIGKVTVNGPEDVSIDFAFESGFERVMEVLGNE